MYQNVEYFCKTKLWFMLIAHNIIAVLFSWNEAQVALSSVWLSLEVSSSEH